MKIAQINPLRYRGYYYDNESGLYYLQSRYYDPELGRFISADSTENINTNNVLALNAYIYCWNSPIVFSDSAGTYPQLSINTGDITAIFNWISKKADENIDNAINGINKLVDIFHKASEKYKAKRDNTLQKIDDFFANPIETINTAFDKLKNSKIGQVLSSVINQVKEYAAGIIKPIKEKISSSINSIKEQLIENVVWIKELHEVVGNIKEMLGIAPEEVDISEIIGSIVAPKFYTVIIADDEKTDNWFEAILKGLVIAFQIDDFTKGFSDIIKSILPSFNFNTWYKNLSILAKDYFDDLTLSTITAINTIFSYFTTGFVDNFSGLLHGWSIAEITSTIFGETINTLLDLFNIFGSINENFSNNSIDYSFMATFIDIGSLITGILKPHLAIGIDIIKDIIEKIIFNFDIGKLWG